VNPPGLRRDLHVIAARCRVSDFSRCRVRFRTRDRASRALRRRFLDDKTGVAIGVKST